MKDERVVLCGGYLKDGLVPVEVIISFMDDTNLSLQFSDREFEYTINAHRLVDSILFLSE